MWAAGESGLPVLDGETFDSAEFTDVVRNEDRGMDHSDRRDEQIVRAYQRTRLSQARPDAAIRRGALVVEGQRTERRQEFLEFGSGLLRVLASQRAVVQFGFNDGTKGNVLRGAALEGFQHPTGTPIEVFDAGVGVE